MRPPVSLIGLLVFLQVSCAARSPDLTGAYRLGGDGRVVLISPSGDDGYRYRDLASGRSQLLRHVGEGVFQTGPGWAGREPVELTVTVVGPVDSLGRAANLEWRPRGETSSAAERLPLREEYAIFTAGGVQLSAKLVLPDGPGPHPAVVLVHGSGREPATRDYWQPYLFASQDIAALVFDKRGTGDSGGRFTMHFPTLAEDVVAAARWVREHREVDGDRVGLAGYSQGGWVAPLAAAQDSGLRFVVVGYGMAESPAQEDRRETLAALGAAGYGDDVFEKADEVLAVVHRLLATDLEEGWDELGRLKRRYGNEPWVETLKAGAAGPFFSFPGWVLRAFGRSRMPPGLPWLYDPLPVLESLDVPMLWLIGAKDAEAPPEGTIERLRGLRARDRPIELHIFPEAGHGIVNVRSDGGRLIRIGYPPDYFRIQADWVRKQVDLSPGPSVN